MRPPSPSIPEKEFIQISLQQSLRIDGRQMLEQREPSITFGPELGWVECGLGKTKVIAQIEAKIVKPTPERPYEGIITIHSELSPMASTEYDTGRPTEEEVTITRMLDKVIRRSDTIDKESLCILAKRRVWHLRLTLHFLSDDGNMLDCGCLAGIIALKHFRRPEVEVIGDDVTIHPPTERAPVPLAMHHTPLCLTFAFFPPSPTSDTTSALVLLDPSYLEQRLSTGLMSVALNAQRELCVVHKLGGVPMEIGEVMGVLDIAVKRAKELNRLVEDKLEEDWNTRKRIVEVR
ncbi:ribosomal protein S5 domain 2-like protein [Pluteus cervinus]|uniref:Ribosomal protein S5 domain 2-like protein n=1 Tax=Pluteus cervinus TaxID=181527 RepID=A0ACD3A1S4_9AGAR|nr:ribosomal protein S5 domain 2-like protein [Pluteus cervinus]